MKLIDCGVHIGEYISHDDQMENPRKTLRIFCKKEEGERGPGARGLIWGGHFYRTRKTQGGGTKRLAPGHIVISKKNSLLITKKNLT